MIFRKSPRKIARKHGLDLCKYEVRRPKIKDVFGAGFRKTIVFWMAGKKGFRNATQQRQISTSKRHHGALLPGETEVGTVFSVMAGWHISTQSKLLLLLGLRGNYRNVLQKLTTQYDPRSPWQSVGNHAGVGEL